MPLIKDARFVDDHWRHLTDDEVPGFDECISVSHARWNAERDTLEGLGAGLGVRLPNTVLPEALARDLGRLSLIVLSFPKFTDGRAYSQARLLRGRLGYTGELRASGEVLRDQLLFMLRCGFDAFAVPERALREDWLAAFREFDVFYQPAEDHRPWLLRQRLVPS